LSNDKNKQGLALLQQGKFGDAAGAFQEAAKSSPKSPGPLNNLGIAQLQAGKRQEALRRDPKNVEAHYNLSLTYLEMGDKFKARVEFLSVRSLNPEMGRELAPLVLPGTPQGVEAR
jgi:Flp pilus assembly protein TadD